MHSTVIKVALVKQSTRKYFCSQLVTGLISPSQSYCIKTGVVCIINNYWLPLAMSVLLSTDIYNWRHAWARKFQETFPTFFIHKYCSCTPNLPLCQATDHNWKHTSYFQRHSRLHKSVIATSLYVDKRPKKLKLWHLPTVVSSRDLAQLPSIKV